MGRLYLCPRCGEHHHQNTTCPVHGLTQKSVSMTGIALATLLGLTACGDEDKDTSTTDTAVTDTAQDTDTGVGEDTSIAVMYGVPDTASWDNDGDGYTPDEGDCDDDNADVHPGAEETPGDGVDSNCNGEDDT